MANIQFPLGRGERLVRSGVQRPTAFELIADAKRVYDMIRDAQAAAATPAA